MRMSARIGVAVAAVVSGLGGSAAAQSAQRFSLQASGAVLFATRADPLYDSKTRLGFE